MSILKRRLVKLESCQLSDGEVTIFSWAEEGEINAAHYGKREIAREANETEAVFLMRALIDATTSRVGGAHPLCLWALRDPSQANSPNGKPHPDVFRIAPELRQGK